MNSCVFSPCERYRYLLIHRWDELLPRRRVVWILLNPGEASTYNVDHTWARVKRFSIEWGFTEFAIVNLFAFVTPSPRLMKRATDPIGPANNAWVALTAMSGELVVAGWGVDGAFKGRADAVLGMLDTTVFYCLGHTRSGQPRHPLYVERRRLLERL